MTGANLSTMPAEASTVPLGGRAGVVRGMARNTLARRSVRRDLGRLDGKTAVTRTKAVGQGSRTIASKSR